MEVKIICDSASDLSQEHFDRNNIEMVPLKVTLNEEEYLDGKTITPKKVYDAMREGAAPKTSQVSPQAFKEFFTRYAEAGQPCIYFALSSELSGTYQTAKMMEDEVKTEHPDFDLHIVDTKCASLGYGLVVLRAAELAADGASIQEILDIGTYHAEHMEHIFTVDDLEYLYRGGRVSKTAAFVGTLLKIKPLLHVEEGKLIPLEKIRGAKKVLKRMLDIMKERGEDLSNQPIAISHADDLENAEQLASMIKEEFGTEQIHIEMVGSAIGAHAGPGTIALFFLNQPYK
ncbi:EDD domain protein, DegV family [Thalassobacillus cyri]|uniref:EDD domain protein, DegV family n=1 Tax=Thalassobacillus cyri TaxID=571932 RepID=A0A1H3VHI3_9BACI|nr:DegV family protein [Thalassobacillus cyri]SDZ74253.1 EDD domain protein, DegV family [Thalassobacillus cyri]